MSAGLSLIGSDLVRALSEAALPRIDAACRARAERVAREAAGAGIVTRVLRRGDGEYAVEMGGTGLDRLSTVKPSEPPLKGEVQEKCKPRRRFSIRRVKLRTEAP